MNFCLTVINGMVDKGKIDICLMSFLINHKLRPFLISSHLHNNGDDEMCDLKLVHIVHIPRQIH